MSREVEADGRVVLIGGGASRVPYRSDTWLFDPLDDTWSQFQPQAASPAKRA